MSTFASIRVSRSLTVSVLAFSFLLCLLVSLASAETEITDDFESWSNPFVANGWTSFSYGGGGGEYNQVFGASQAISCGGDGNNFKSIYRDFPVVPGHEYSFWVQAKSNATNKSGIPDDSLVRFWIQFDDASGNVLATFGTDGREARWGPVMGPGIERLRGLSYGWADMWLGPFAAPAGSHHVRVILQVMGGSGGGALFRDLNFSSRTEGQHTVLLVRSTEWASNSPVPMGWGSYSYGGGPGDYERRAGSGSAQGISVSGNGSNYKQVYRDLPVMSGNSCSITAHFISNSTNTAGARDSSYVRMYVQFMDAAGNVLATYSRSGADGPPFVGDRGEDKWMNISSMVAPAGSHHARVILRVYGGTGGGTLFDDLWWQTTPGTTSSSQGEIWGRVIAGGINQPIALAAVRINNVVVPTNANGEFRFSLVNPGTYTIYYDAAGFRGQTQLISVEGGMITVPPTVIMYR